MARDVWHGTPAAARHAALSRTSSTAEVTLEAARAAESLGSVAALTRAATGWVSRSNSCVGRGMGWVGWGEEGRLLPAHLDPSHLPYAPQAYPDPL